MSLDHSAVWKKIQELVRSDRPVGDCMAEVIRVCATGVPHRDWRRFSELDYDADVASLQLWIPEALKHSPAPFIVRGLLVCLCNPSDGEKVWADMYVGVVADYDAADEEELRWVFGSSGSHYPEQGYASSQSLRTIYEIAYAPKTGLGNDAEWPLALAFAAFAVRSLLKAENHNGCLGSSASQVGVAVGFDSGDMLKIGEWTNTGFAAGSGTQ